MSDAWSIIAVAGIAAIVILYLRSRKAGSGTSGRARQVGTAADRNYTQERADDRRARMSDDDRTWEAASLQRNRELRAQDDAPAERGAPLG